MWETPGSGRSPGEGNGNPLQYSCLEIHGWRSLVGYSPWGRKESDTTEQLHLHFLCMLVTVSLCSPLSTPPKGTSHEPLMMSWSSSCQQFWHRGPIIWKTIFPRMRSGGWFHDDSNALAGRGYFLWPMCSLDKTLLAYALLHFVLQKPDLPVTPGISWFPTLALHFLMMKMTSFFGIRSRRYCMSS